MPNGVTYEVKLPQVSWRQEAASADTAGSFDQRLLANALGTDKTLLAT